MAGVDDDDAAHACLWPGELQFAARDDGASFALPVTVHARAAVPLPGDADVWPLEVSSEGRSLAVVANDEGAPVVWLAPGQYRIEGGFVWDERPESIALPASIARIALSLDAVAQPFVQRDDDALWLGRVAAAVAERDSLAVDVFRLLEDRRIRAGLVVRRSECTPRRGWHARPAGAFRRALAEPGGARDGAAGGSDHARCWRRGRRPRSGAIAHRRHCA
ncbi:MAG: hypothetical protein IPF83_06185 [Rhodanobacteraceae bacterium]|nr:hypothetical protein [Rhodanobacteraceae bacterium]